MKKLIEIQRGQSVPDDAKWVKDFTKYVFGASEITIDVWEVKVDEHETFIKQGLGEIVVTSHGGCPYEGSAEGKVDPTQPAIVIDPASEENKAFVKSELMNHLEKYKEQTGMPMSLPGNCLHGMGFK